MKYLSQLLLLLVVVSQGSFAARYSFTSDRTPQATLSSQILDTDPDTLPSVRLELNLTGIDVDPDTDGFKQLFLRGLTPMGEIGMPDLSASGRLVAVPKGFIAKLKVVEDEVNEIPEVNVRPFQRKSRCRTGDNGFRFNSAFYNSRGVYPSQTVSLEEVGSLQGLKILRVAMNPIQVDRENNSLKVHSKLSVTVELEQVSEAPTTLLSSSFYKLATAIAVNGENLFPYVNRKLGPETMVIFTADEFKDAIAPLVQWKRERGLTVRIFSMSEVAQTSSAQNTKDFLESYVKQNGYPTYLLFVGNATTVPPFKATTDYGPAATEFPFSQLSGDDFVPDALYGRLVADNLEELKTQMARWIAYERNPESAGAWYQTGTTVASGDGFDPSDAEYATMVREQLSKATYTELDAFEFDKENATPENIIASMNKGRSWVSYFGHGSGTSWASTNGEFSNEHVEQFTNTTRLPVVFDVACLNAAYDTEELCFGKKWVTHTHNGQPAGAVAFYGGSVSVSWHPPAIMSTGIAKYHFEKSLQTVGLSVLAGQLYLLEKQGMRHETLDNLEWYNLFGDPSLQMRTTAPKEFEVLHAFQEYRDNTVLEIQTKQENGQPVSGLDVVVTSGNADPIAVGTTDANGKALLTLKQVPTRTLLTVSGYNSATRRLVLR